MDIYRSNRELFWTIKKWPRPLWGVGDKVGAVL
jgi:hypothetical protein